jgi:hypothetical protein
LEQSDQSHADHLAKHQLERTKAGGEHLDDAIGLFFHHRGHYLGAVDHQRQIEDEHHRVGQAERCRAALPGQPAVGHLLGDEVDPAEGLHDHAGIDAEPLEPLPLDDRSEQVLQAGHFGRTPDVGAVVLDPARLDPILAQHQDPVEGIGSPLAGKSGETQHRVSHRVDPAGRGQELRRIGHRPGGVPPPRRAKCFQNPGAELALDPSHHRDPLRPTRPSQQ